MWRLSSPHSRLKSSYQIVIVGSGYGGGIAASRLSRAGQEVCVLEHGREFARGEFPSTLPEMMRQSQMRLSGSVPLGRKVGSPLALLDMHVEKEMSVLRGCGLGGGSLVNASVSLEADVKVFADPRWPAEFRADVPTRLAEGYQRAREVLDPKPYPKDWPKLGKSEAHLRSGAAMGERAVTVPINVSFEDRINPFGVDQPKCNLCGDCVMGCNSGAKTTVAASYLPDAWNHGAQIFTEIAVHRVEARADGRWAVYYDIVGSGRDGFEPSGSLVLIADIVILAAGALGSTEILLRSKAAGLSTSERVGHAVSSNGGVLGFAFDTEHKINGVAAGRKDSKDRPPVGPCITTIIDGRTPERSLEEQFVIEEGSLPATMRPIYPAFPAVPRGLEALGEDVAVAEAEPPPVRRQARYGKTLSERIANSQTFLGMGVDKGSARLYLDDTGHLRCDWRDADEDPIYKTVNRMMAAATAGIDGTYVPNPMSTSPLGSKRITVHPLGGCGMGEDATRGATNHRGEVFSGSTGTDVHKGLLVMDGSVLPLAVGVNPLLTISAVAERSVALLAEARGWTIPYALDHRPTQRRSEEVSSVGIRFTERMTGFFAPAGNDQSYQSAADAGEAVGRRLSLLLTVCSEDLEATLADPKKTLRIDGTVDAPSVSPEPLQVRDGKLSLLVGDAVEIGVRTMHYDMSLQAADGRRWTFHGHKRVAGERLVDLWAETTTLNFELWDDNGRMFRGAVRINVQDFLRQLSTLRVVGSRSKVKSVQTLGRFAKYFSGSLFKTYGGRLASPVVFEPKAPARARRGLRTDAPSLYPFVTSDGVPLLLTRYRGGFKGPVMLVHGLGVSSGIFTVDTIDTNLTEYLVAHGYDVWLLDFRASIALAASREQFTGDDIANIDLPEAVEQIRRHTGADSIQVLAHCFGSTVFFMSMLAGGLAHVRSAVVSQTGAHVDAAGLVRLKSRLRLPSLLKAAGVEALSAYTDSDAGWTERLYNRSLSFYPVSSTERCSSATCRRISFMYSLLYRHEQLSVDTHDTLHELFGSASLSAFDHLAAMVRAGHLVNAKGEDVYLPHVQRLSIPMRIIHGEMNECFHPHGTEKTLAWLRAHNDPSLYSRVVIPGFGHLDTMFGKNAVKHVYPHILQHLESTL